MKNYKIIFSSEFDDWFTNRPDNERYQIQERFHRITEEGHFGDHKSVSNDNSIWELRWKNGRRIYYTYFPEAKILLLLGGNKNGQKKDIKRAENILAKIN